MKQRHRTSEEDRLLNELMPYYKDLPPELIRHLLDLVKAQLPTLDTYGAKKQLTREIKTMVESAVVQKKIAE